MDKKELYSMKKHRGVLMGLGLAAILGLTAGQAKAETLTLSVIYGGSTFAFTGSSTSVSVPATVINDDLAGSGYTFSNLGGVSNWFGSNTSVGAFVQDSGSLSRSGGTGGDITIILTESGFTLPSGGSGAQLSSAPAATFAGTTTSSTQKDMGTYTSDANSANTVSTPQTTLTSNGTATDSHSGSATAGIPSYVTPYTLTLTETINLTQRSSSSAADGLGSTVSVLSVPEPAGLVMMVTAMPLPLVVLGLLRRRRAAA